MRYGCVRDEDVPVANHAGQGTDLDALLAERDAVFDQDPDAIAQSVANQGLSRDHQLQRVRNVGSYEESRSLEAVETSRNGGFVSPQDGHHPALWPPKGLYARVAVALEDRHDGAGHRCVSGDPLCRRVVQLAAASLSAIAGTDCKPRHDGLMGSQEHFRGCIDSRRQWKRICVVLLDRPMGVVPSGYERLGSRCYDG